jgi:predicted PurR-regulated permease PerM
VEEVIEAVVSLVFLVMIASVLVQIPSMMDTGNPELEAEIDQKEKTIEQLRNEIDQLEQRNQNLSERYERLLNGNVTKKDVEEIEYRLNRTSSEIQILNQKFETVNNQFIDSYQKTVNKYQLWFSVSLLSLGFLAFNLFQGAMFGRSFNDKIEQGLRVAGNKIRGRFSEPENSEDKSEDEGSQE